jgi:hypothetical protein
VRGEVVEVGGVQEAVGRHQPLEVGLGRELQHPLQLVHVDGVVERRRGLAPRQQSTESVELEEDGDEHQLPQRVEGDPADLADSRDPAHASYGCRAQRGRCFSRVHECHRSSFTPWSIRC